MGKWIKERKEPERKGKTKQQKIVGKVASYCKALREHSDTDLKQYQCVIWVWDQIHDGKLTEEQIDEYLSKIYK